MIYRMFSSLLQPTKVLHYMICACMCKKSCYGIHFANDWLIACWAMVVGCALSAFISLVLLFDAIVLNSGLHIYEYITGSVMPAFIHSFIQYIHKYIHT